MNRSERSKAIAVMTTALVAMMVTGCATSLNDQRSVEFESRTVPVGSPAEPIQIAPETTHTACVPDELLPRRSAKEVRAFFGFFSDQCVGVVPGELVGRTVVVGFDEVRGKSPARDAGLRPRDVVITFNGCRVVGVEDLHVKMANFTAGNVAEVFVARKAEHRYIPVKVLIATVPLMGTPLRSMHCGHAGLSKEGAFSGD